MTFKYFVCFVEGGHIWQYSRFTPGFVPRNHFWKDWGIICGLGIEPLLTGCKARALLLSYLAGPVRSLIIYLIVPIK